MSKWFRRVLIALPSLLAAAAIAAPFIGAGQFRAPLLRKLERAFGRPVEINGDLKFQIVPRFGFSAEQIVIHELPPFGVEPFAYAESMDVSVSMLSLLARRVDVAGIRLVKPSINLMKHPEGGWNFQAFVDRARSGGGALPGIEVIGGRVNFKSGETKSVFYLADTDLSLDADVASPDRFGIKIEGEPARTDRATRAFGRLSGRGMITLAGRPEDSVLELSLALERMPVAELAMLVEGRSIGLSGLLTSRARLSGPLANIAIEGRLEVQDFERFRWLIPRAAGWGIDYKGSLDLPGQTIQVETAAPPKAVLPLGLRLRASQLLSRPRWAALVSLRDAPLASMQSLARDLGAAFPRDWPLEGRLSGVIGFSPISGPQGQLSLDKASVAVPELPPIEFDSAQLLLDRRRFTLQPAVLRFRGEKQSAMTVEGSMDADSGARDIRLTARSLDLGHFQTAWKSFLGAPPAPMLDRCSQGLWSGTVRLRQKDQDAPPDWSGEARIDSAQCRFEGLPRPLNVKKAAITLNGTAVSVHDAEGEYGNLSWSGIYSFDIQRRRPHRVNLAIAEARIEDFEALLMPAFQRSSGLIARTLRRVPPPPDWLRARRLEGTVEIGVLSVADYQLHDAKSRIFWEGTRLQLSNIGASLGEGKTQGRVFADLAGIEPVYHGHWELENVNWRGGKLDAETEIESFGLGAGFLSNLQLQGSFHARDITMSPENEWSAVNGCFLYNAREGGPRLQLTGLQAVSGAESFLGQGVGTAEGRLLVELSNSQRQIRIAGRINGLNLDFSK